MLRSFLRTVIVYLSLSTSARAIIENARGHGRYLTAAGLFRGRMSSKEVDVPLEEDRLNMLQGCRTDALSVARSYI